MIKVAVAGGWDPLHIGHIRHMKLARELGDYLIVIIDNDENLIRKKGFVYYPEGWRIELVKDYRFVDEVVLNIDHTECSAETLKLIRPNIFAKGGDREPFNMPEKEIRVCEEIGCKIVYGVGDTLDSSTARALRIIGIGGRKL